MVMNAMGSQSLKKHHPQKTQIQECQLTLEVSNCEGFLDFACLMIGLRLGKESYDLTPT